MKMKWCLFLITFSCLTCYCSEEKRGQSQVSEDLAQVFWNMMTVYEGEYDFEELVVNLQKLNAGQLKARPLNDCYPSLMESLEKKAEKKGLDNLQSAESYLREISNMRGVHVVVKERLYYKVLNAGQGGELPKGQKAPMITYKEKTLNGEVISENNSGTCIPFSEMIQGLRKGMEGMKVGETREIFIHPDLAYGEFPKPEPYSLIIIEVTTLGN